MGYLEQHSHSNRGGMMVAAAALNGLVIYGLLAAFNGVPFERFIDHPLEAWTKPKETVLPIEPLKPKPAAGPVRHEEANRQEVEVIDFTLGSGPLTLPPLDPPGGGGILAEKPQVPAFAPKGAVPLGNPGAWAGEADYPGADLRAGHAGTTRFRLTIGADGRVGGCEVIGSSGWPGLDEATCRLVSARARFRAATDGTGAAATGTFSSAIHWVIPG